MIQIEGLYPERFLNAAAREKIRLFRLWQGKDGSLRALLSMGDFYRLHRLSPALRGRIRILKKGGFPMGLVRLRFRKVLLLGWLPFLFALLLSSRFLWFIRIEGASGVEEQAILRCLKEQGVYPGVLRRDIPMEDLKTAIRGMDPSVAWAGASLRGVVLTLRLHEAETIPKEVTGQGPSHIIAQKDARIKSIVTLDGRQLVNAGTAVKAGDRLISGMLEREGFETLYIEARGTVVGELAYVFQASAGPELSSYVPTGREESYSVLSLFGKSFTAYRSSFREYECRMEESTVLSGNLLPLCFQRFSCGELCLQTRPAGEEELQNAALRAAEEKALSAIPKTARILSKQSRTQRLENGAVLAEIIYITEEEIGISIPIQQE